MLSSSLLKDALVIAILFLMSAVPPSSLVTLAPRYVNLSTSFASLFQTLRLALLLLFTFIYIYRISWHSASSQLLLSCLQALLSSTKPRSSSTVVKFKRIPVFSFLTVCCITQSIIIIEKRNKKPDMQQPCLTPVIKEKGAVTLYLVVLNRKALKHHTGRKPSSSVFWGVFHTSPSLGTKSNAFSKSTKWMYMVHVAFHSLACSRMLLRIKI